MFNCFLFPNVVVLPAVVVVIVDFVCLLWLSLIVMLTFSVNLLAFYHECHYLIGYATRYLFCNR